MFKVGDRIVYPMHGAGVVEGLEEKDIAGEIKTFYVLKLPTNNMQVKLPVDSVSKLGVRKILSSDRVQDVIDLLAMQEDVMSSNWNRRYRSNLEKIKTGDIFEVAAVVRNLELLDRSKGLSTGERKMLNSTKQILVSELVLAQNAKEEDVVHLVETTIKAH